MVQTTFAGFLFKGQPIANNPAHVGNENTNASSLKKASAGCLAYSLKRAYPRLILGFSREPVILSSVPFASPASERARWQGRGRWPAGGTSKSPLAFLSPRPF